MATSDNNTTTVLVTKSESMVTVQEGAVIQIPFGTVEEVILSQDGGNLVITPLGGGEPLTLENFFVAGETSAPASLQIGENGPILTVDQIIGLTEDFNPDAIAPAAGPAAGGAGGGGAGFSAYNDDGIGDGIGIENLLDPTELEFQTREEEEFLQGEEADEADGTIDLTFLSTDPEGELSPISGGYEDWQPYQNFGSGYTVPMQVFANFTPADDETISEITLSGFPEGARFFVGGTDAANEVAIVDGSVTISAVDGVLPPLFMLPPANSDADIPLSVSADIVDASGETAVITGEGTVIVDAAADAVSLSVSSEPMTGGNGNDFGYGNGDYQYPPQVPDANVYCSHEDAAFTVDVSAQFGDNVDGSESHTVVVEIPAGWTVSDGAGGVWAPGADGTSGTLTFTVPVGPGQSGAFNASPSFLPPEDFSGSADFVVRAVAEENPSDGELVVENNVAIAQETISVNVVPEADDPVFELTGVSLQNGLYMTKEDNSVDIGFSVKTGEYAKNPGATDGSENLSFVAISGFGGWTVSGDDITAIENMPEVWGVSQSGSELHIWFNPGVETFDLSGLTLTPPEDSDADIDLGNLVFKVSVNDQGVDCYGNPNDGYDNAYEEYESGIVVDAVLDQYAEVSADELAPGTESAADQNVNLGLSMAFEATGYGAPSDQPADTTSDDTDGSEVFTITVTLDEVSLEAGVGLTLGTGAPSDATLTEGPDGTWTLNVSDPADLEVAVGLIEAVIPAGYEGTINGTISSVSEDTAPGGVETDLSDNKEEDSADFSLTIEGGEVVPTASFGDGEFAGIIKEDSDDNTISFSAASGDSTDELTSVVITLPGVTNGDVDVSAITADLAGDGSVAVDVDPVTGATIITITFNDSADLESFSSSFTLDAPVEDSDADLSATITAYAKDKTDATATGDGGETKTIVVDAVLDRYAEVSADELAPGTESAADQNVNLGLSMEFEVTGYGAPSDQPADTTSDDTDGSETFTITVTLDGTAVTAGVGLVLGDDAPSDATLTEGPGGTWTLTANTPADLAAAVNDIEAVIPAGYEGTINGTISSVSEDTAPGGVETDLSDNKEEDSADFSLTIEGGEVVPTAAFGDGEFAGIIKEDSVDNTINFSAASGDSTDELTSVVITLPGVGAGDVDVSAITADLAGDGTVQVTEAGGTTTITITFNDSADLESFSSSFTLDAPVEDSDADLSATITAYAKDKTDATETGDGGETKTIVVDAVLDRFADVEGGAAASGTESDTVQNLNLGLGMQFAASGFTPTDSTPDDTDGSETFEITVTLDAAGVGLALGDDAPNGATLTETSSGSGEWVLTVSDPADLQGAVEAIEAVVPAGYEGTINGSISSVSEETLPNNDEEDTLADNRKEDSADFSLTIEGGEVIPTAAFGDSEFAGIIKEDSVDNTINFSAASGDSTDELTSVVITLPGVEDGDVDVSAIETALGVGTPGEIGTVVVSEAGGTTTITITFNDSADLESFSSSFTLDAPVEDSDADLSATITAYAKDKTDATETGNGGETKTIVVDAVLDRFADVEGGAAASGTESDTVQNLNLGLGMQFAASGFTPTDSTPDDTDGSETFEITVTLDAAGVGLALGDDAPNGATLTETSSGSGEWVLTVSDPADLQGAVEAIEAVVPAGYEGTINGSISSVSEETLPNNDEEDTLADNRKEDSADFSLTIEGGEVVPTAAFGDGEFAGIIKEDSVDNTISFSAASGDSTDELTSVVITLPGVEDGDVDVSAIETALGVGTPGEIGTVVVSEAGGTTTITITFNDSADLESFSSSFTLDAPVEDSDADLSATITAYAKDKTDATETGDGGETKTIVVDAVLDRFADVEGGAAASGTESDTVQNLNLGLGMQFAASGFTPTDSTPDDTDGSETFTITVTLHGTAVTAGVGLVLGAGAPSDATLTEGPDGTWTLNVSDPADLEVAVGLIEAVVPAGYEGTINGSISSVSEETLPNNDEEDTLADNRKEDSADFSLTIEGGEVVPTAAFGDGEFAGIIKEDSVDNTINFSAASGDSTDELTSVVITLPGVTNGDVDVTDIETALGVGTPGEIGTVVVSEAGGTTTITITFNDSADLESFSSSFTLDAPVEDSDADLSATITAYAKDKTDATETGDGGETKTIVVDAVLDRFADVEGGAAASGTESDTVQNLNLGLGMQFAASGFTPTDSTPDDTDGSETFEITVTLHGTAVTAGVGLTLGTGAPNGATLTETSPGSGVWKLGGVSAADLEDAIEAIEAVVPAGYEGTINGSISSLSEETEPNADEEDTLADNSKEDSADFSLTIEGGEVVPTAAFGDGEFAGIIKEDSDDNVINFSAASGDSTDELTRVVITLPGVGAGDVDVSAITADLAGDGTVAVGVDPVTGATTITIIFNNSADLESFSSSFTLDAPVEDSDADLSATITAYAKDKTDATETGNGGETKTIVVDAVLDYAVNVGGDAAISVVQANNDPIDIGDLSAVLNPAGFANSTTNGTDFGGADGDGSELVTMVVEVNQGASLGWTLPAGISVSGTGPWTFTGTTEDIAGWNSLVDSFNVTTTPGFNGDVTVSIKTTTEEANTPDGTVVGSGVEDDIADNTSEENVHTVTISVSSDTAGGSVGGTRSVAEDNDANQDDTGRVSADQQVSIAVGDVFTPADNEEVTGATLTFSGVTVTINGVAITSGTALTTTQLAAWNAGTGIEVTVDADSDEDVSIDFDIDFVDPDSGQTGNATGDFVIEVDAVADLPTGTEMGIATNGVAYFIAGSSGGNNTTLYSVDLDSSNPDIAPTAIGTINYMIGASSYSSSDFEALGSADGYLYGITTSGHVVTLDPSTVDGSGNVTVVNAFDLSLGDVISDQAGATYANGQFYVISTSGNTSQMFAVDPTTGAATNIATLSGTKVDGLAYDTANNQFWTVVNDGAHTYAYKMTVSGGTITLSNQIEIPGNPDIQSIAYGTNGKIWVIERTNPGNVFEIDPDTSTLTSTFTIDNSDVSSSGIENLTITTSTGTNVDSGEQFGVTLKGTFGDVTDGSEVHYFLVEVPAGFTAQNPALLVTYSGGNGPDGIPDGTYIKVDADALMIGNTAIGNAVLIAPENMPSDTNFDIKVYTVAEETNLAGDEESDLTNNVAVTEDTVTITVEAASNTLNMAFAVREMALDVVGSDPNSDAELSEQSFGVNHQANNFKWDGDVEITINGETKSLSDLTSHGTPIDITVENGGHKLVGSTPAGEVFVLTLKPGTSGDYEFELKGPIDHPAVDADGGDDVITLGVSYSSNTHDGVVSIDIVDDVPAAVNHQHTGEISLPDYNVAISIDISTSMDDRHDGTNTRLDTAKAAAIELATELFAAGGDVSISLSVFADGGFVIGQFTDLASFMDAVDDIDFSNSSWAQQQGVSGGTNYNDAVNGMRTGLETFFAGDQAPGTQKLAYFLSDGKHNEDSFNSSSWQNFVAANGVKSYAVAIGGDINNPTSDNDLRGVSYDPENPGSSSANILVVDDPSELAATLTDTILDVVSGNIFDGTAGGHYGADGAGGIVDITVFGNTYDVNSPEVTGTVLEATDANGNLFTFDFDTGSYEFRVDDTVSGVDTTISYTLEDWDGDQAVGTIDIDVDVVPNAPAAYDNAAYVEQSGMGNVSVVLEDFSDNSGWDEFGDGGLSGGEGEVSTNWWGGAMSPESLESNLGLPTGTIEGISGLNNVDEGSAIVIDTFAATTGDTVTFDWSFDQSNFGPADGSFYILKNMDTGALTTGTLRVGSDGSGQQTLTIPSSGSYQVILGVVDMNNGNGISTLNVDNVVLNTTGLVEKVVTGNVLSDPMNDAASDDWWGATDFVEYGTELTSVEHDGTVYTLVNGTVTFTTVLGGTFEINADGSYSYAAPDNVSGVEEEVFTYTLTDISGDTDTANLTVHVGEDASHMPLNWTGTSVADLMHGTANDDVLVGMAGDDTLYGEGGDDYIVGGAGDDTLFGGDGADRFVYQSANDGEDVIKDFDMTEGDQVNLDALFDSLGIVGAENRANMVEITDNGGNQELTIDGVSDFKIVFENFSDLTASGTEPFSETDLQNMKIVVDES